MAHGTKRVSKRKLQETESIFNKYASLLHIVNGEEEFILDQDGFITGCKLDASNVTGYDEYEIMGKHLSIFYRPEEMEMANAHLERVGRLGNTVVHGVRVKKRGVNFWGRMKIKSVIPHHQNLSQRFSVVLQDVTHRILSRERIRTLKDQYLSVFNNPFVGTFKFSLDGYRIQMCNQKAMEILGTKKTTDLPFDRFFASLHQFELFISALRTNKRLEGFKFQVQAHDGKLPQENWAVISARYFEAQGFAEGVLIDVTEQHTQMIELQRVNAELDNFIYHASHDLRSPLTSIMGLVNLALQENSVDVVYTYLKAIRGRVDHLDILLRDLLSVSYNFGIEKEYAHSFHFEDEVNSIQKLLKIPNPSFRVNVEVSQQIDFKTDPVRMRTILRNLLSNAFIYYNPDVHVHSIHLNIRVGPSHCAILLKDNGIGIHQEYKNRIYDMFFRATERSGGNGLGLYIVKAMVQKLKGRISFESTLNVGTTFLLTIPNQAPQTVLPKDDDYNHYSLLTSDQIELVENSWDAVLLNSQETGAVFYNKLFSIDPELRKMFKGDISTQSQKLVAMITFTVHKLNNLDEVVSDVKALGIQHKKNSVRPEHYATVASALLWTLENGLGRTWNDAVREAWIAVYNTLSKIMIEVTE